MAKRIFKITMICDVEEITPTDPNEVQHQEPPPSSTQEGFEPPVWLEPTADRLAREKRNKRRQEREEAERERQEAAGVFPDITPNVPMPSVEPPKQQEADQDG